MNGFLDRFKTCKKINEQRVMTCWFRASFLYAFERQPPMEGSTGEGKYCVTMLFDEEKVDISEIKEMAKKVGEEKWPNGKFAKLVRDPSFKNPIREGDTKDYDGYAGMTFIKASSKHAPGVVGPDNSMITVTSIPGAYSGAYYRATVGCYGYDNVSKGIAFSLYNLQKLADGEPFGAKQVDAADEFGAVSDSSFSGGDDVDPFAF